MRKYLVLFFQSFSFSSSYRFQILLTLIQGFITPILMLIALSFAHPVSRLTAASLIPYYLVIGIIFPLVNCSVDEEMDELSISGDINNFLSKPIDLYKWLLIKNFSEKLVHLTYLGLPLFLVSVVIPAQSSLLFRFPSLLLSVFLSALIYFQLSYLTGLFSFWIDEFWAIRNLKHVIIQFFGGFVVPLAFFPSWLSCIVRHSPFYYLGGWNSSVFDTGILYPDLVWIGFWLIFTWALIRLLQAKAISKYSFTGS